MAQKTLMMSDFTLYISVLLEEIICDKEISALIKDNKIFIRLRDFLDNGGLSTINISSYNLNYLTFSVEGEITPFQLDTLKEVMRMVDYSLVLIYVKDNNLILKYSYTQPKK